MTSPQGRTRAFVRLLIAVSCVSLAACGEQSLEARGGGSGAEKPKKGAPLPSDPVGAEPIASDPLPEDVAPAPADSPPSSPGGEPEPVVTPEQPPPAPSTPDRLSATFQGMSAAAFGAVTLASLESEFREKFDWIAAPQELSVVVEADGSRALRQRYVPTKAGSDVVSFPVPIQGGTEQWLSYRVLFEPGWQWVQGGKLPGLAGGTYPTGGTFDDNGFSARMMWRKDGELAVYAYHHDRPQVWGEDFFLVNADGSRFKATVGQWLTITQRVKMNSSGEARDGEVEVWINGEQKLLRTGVRWRKNLSYDVDTFLYSSFYGGSDATWAPTTTTYARFDDIKIASTASGVQ